MMEERVNENSSLRKPKKHLQISNCVYTSCYCEENVWKMCDQIRKSDTNILGEYYVVFISNKNNSVPLWMQKQSKDPLTPVVWDYHVVLVQKPASEKAVVYDMDSIMGFPCPLDHYLDQAIQSEKSLKKEYHRKFRIVPAARYLENFASDRSHMLKANGQYIKPPPNYSPIRTAHEMMNLDEFISMSSKIGEGVVKELNGFVEYFKANFPG